MPGEPPTILISAGEASGDLLAAELVRELGETQLVGIGGDALAGEGMEVLVHARELAVVGLTEVLSGIPRYLRALSRMRRVIEAGGVDLVLLVDFPDFNLRLARIAAAAGIPVVYYVSPQVWAWRRGRLRTLARRIDRMLTLLPFEPALYRAEGVPATHVGHPLRDRVAPFLRDDDGAPEPMVALMPGSRTGEVRAHWDVFLDTAREVRRSVEDARFVAVRAPTVDPALLPVPDDLPIEIEDGPAAGVLCRARCALVASGTATLEAALCGTPHAVAYRVHPLTYAIGRLLVRGVDRIALSNLVAKAPVAPEFLQALDPQAMAEPLVRWMRDEGAWRRTRQLLRQAGDRVGEPGAAARAADQVREALMAPPRPVRPPGRRELWILAAAALALVAARVGLGLTHPLHPDEAYFWRWSLDPAWGYFDQPPMVAWMIAAARAVAGDTLAAVRLPSALCSAGALVLVYLTAREHLAPRRAAAAPGLLLATPLLAVGGLVTTPDAPLSLAWAAFLYAATRACAPRGGLPPPADRWIAPWLWLGVAIALGLLSKLTMLAAPVCLGVFWALRRQLPPWRGALAGGALSALLLGPWLAWNSAHGWAPFAWELSHGLHPQSGNPISRLGEFLGGQAGIVGPVWLGAAIWFWVRTLRESGEGNDRPDRGPALLWTALSAPLFLGFAAASLSAPSAANWPAMAYPAVACGLALVAGKRLLRWAIGTSAVLSLVALAHLLAPLAVVPPRIDPLADTAGYEDLARTAEIAAAGLGEDTILLASRYQDAAALAFQLEDPRRVADVPARGRPTQWDLWPDDVDGPALFVSLGEAPDAGCDPVGIHLVRYRDQVVRRYMLYPCRPPADEDPWWRPATLR